MEHLINAEGLTKRYPGFTLDNVSLSVPEGRIVGLVGSNGAGKTTLIKALLGLIDVDGGTARILGRSLYGTGKEIDSVKQRIGVVLDTCAFLSTMRIRDVATLGRMSYDQWDAARFKGLCEQFGLDPKKTVKDLSRGMGMKLTLAFALSHHPELLILDEVTAGLDPISRDELLDILRTFMADEGHAILMVTHITTDLEKIADEVVCIDGGRIFFDIPKEAICDEAGLVHCRASDLERVVQSGLAKNAKNARDADAASFKVMRRNYGVDLLVPDRFAFSAAFPDLACERISIEDYMALVLKGESL